MQTNLLYERDYVKLGRHQIVEISAQERMNLQFCMLTQMLKSVFNKLHVKLRCDQLKRLCLQNALL